MVQPKKHLGQHFLTDLGIAKKVANNLADAEINEQLKVIEIGFGKGVLTQFLFQMFDQNIIAFDVDEESHAYMLAHYPERKDQLFLQDFLKYSFDESIKNHAVIGNFPYNISSQIVFSVLENMTSVKYFTGMFQKEVARRLCAAEGSKEYGILSVLLNTFYNTQYCFDINPGAFNPPPKVISGVIYAERKEDFILPVPFNFYKTVIKTAFNQRRKMMRNSLQSLGISKIEVNPYFTMRPEQLSFVHFITLSELLYKVQ